MLEVQRYLLGGKTLADLKAGLDITFRHHSHYTDLVLLKYSQIDSPKSHPIVRECRGLILDQMNNWAVVSRPLDRFFNLGEGCADTLDLATTRCYEKLDGSLMCLYWYANRWQVQTSGTPDAFGRVGYNGPTFKELFWQTWAELGYTLPAHSFKHLTFVFELTGPLNQVVVQYEKPCIRLLAVRSKETGQELSPETAAQFNGWQCVQSFPFSGVDALDLSVCPTQQEGYVLVDAQYKRVKVKTAAYVALHRSANGMTAADAMAIVMQGEIDEVKAYFPKYAALLDELADKFALLEECVLTEWEQHRHLVADRREFAIAIRDLPFKGSLFLMADDKDWLAAMLQKPANALAIAEATHKYYVARGYK